MKILSLTLALAIFAGSGGAAGAPAATAGKSAPARTPPILPLDAIRPGMIGVGRTVFSGDTVQPFRAHILGVMHNMMGPGEDVILARLSGGPLAQTGVLEGMSGSPVYVGGKLIGAVALGFAFAKEPIAGITPIQEMLSQERTAREEARRRAAAPSPLRSSVLSGRLHWVSRPEGDGYGNAAAPALPGELPQLQTPLVFSGFTPAAVQTFLPEWQSMGLAATIGGSAANDIVKPHPLAAPAAGRAGLRPGDMISVQLMRGDLDVAADGTVTAVLGRRVYAFGHHFLNVGDVAMPFARAQVLGLMPGYMSSFKISVSGAPLGVIHQDLSRGVYGTLGGEAPMVPVRVRILGAPGQAQVFHFEMINNSVLTPILFNMALYSTLDALEKGLGPETVQLSGAVHLAGVPDARIQALVAGDRNIPALAAAEAARPLALLYAGGQERLPVRGIDISIRASERARILTLQQAWPERQHVYPGERLGVTAVFTAPGGAEVARTLTVQVPYSLAPGPLQLWIGAPTGPAPNAPALPLLPAALPQLVAWINRQHTADRIELRLQRPGVSYRLAGENFPAPPPSLARALAGDPAVLAGMPTQAAPALATTRSQPLPFLIRGSRICTVQVVTP